MRSGVDHQQEKSKRAGKSKRRNVNCDDGDSSASSRNVLSSWGPE
jgi:hypothetical protein